MPEINPYEAPQSIPLQQPHLQRQWFLPLAVFFLQMLFNTYLIWVDKHAGLGSIRIFAPLWFVIPFIGALGFFIALLRLSKRMMLIQLLFLLCDLFVYVKYF